MMREAQGLTLRALAEKSHTSHSYLSQIERGDKTSSPEWLRSVLDALTDNLLNALDAVRDASPVVVTTRATAVAREDAAFMIGKEAAHRDWLGVPVRPKGLRVVH